MDRPQTQEAEVTAADGADVGGFGSFLRRSVRYTFPAYVSGADAKSSMLTFAELKCT